MATQSLIQRLETGDGVSVGHRRDVETFLADGAIAAGAPVMFDLAESSDGDITLKVVESSADKAAIGVALASAVAGVKVQVVLGGIVDALVKGTNNAGNSAVAQGDFLCQGDVAGELYKYTIGADAVPTAVAIDTCTSGEAAGLKTVIWLRQF
jgi:hypothetical protein